MNNPQKRLEIPDLQKRAFGRQNSTGRNPRFTTFPRRHCRGARKVKAIHHPIYILIFSRFLCQTSAHFYTKDNSYFVEGLSCGHGQTARPRNDVLRWWKGKDKLNVSGLELRLWRSLGWLEAVAVEGFKIWKPRYRKVSKYGSFVIGNFKIWKLPYR